MDLVVALLRRKFYWLGPNGSYIKGRTGRTLHIKAVHCAWRRDPLQPYLRSIEERFAGLGFRVEWTIELGEFYESQVAAAALLAEKEKCEFDRDDFIRQKQLEEETGSS